MRNSCVLDGIRTSSVDFVVGVPDSGLVQITDLLTPHAGGVSLVREDAAIGAAAGAALAGRRPLIFMKNAGLGAASDAVVSLLIASGLPALMLVGWAGSGRDRLAHHVVWGERTLNFCEALGLEVLVHTTSCNGQCSTNVRKFADTAFERQVVRVLVVSS